MQRLFTQNYSVFRCGTKLGAIAASFLTIWSANAATSLDFQVPFYSRLSDGSAVVTNRTFNTATGPSDGLRLLTGMRLVKSGSDGVYIGIDRSTVLRVTVAGETVNESTAKPELADWSMGVTFDLTAQRVVLVTLGGEGALYQRTPDGVWSTIASMQNEDLESLVYRAADNCFYGIEVYNGAPSVPATLLKYSATGEKLAEIPLPAFPVNLSPGNYTAKLVAVEGKIAALVERDPTQILEPTDHSRIYVIDPVSGTTELTYDHLGNSAGNLPVVNFIMPTNTSFTLGETFTFYFNVSDTDNDLASIDVFDGTTLLKSWSFDQPNGSQVLHLNFDWTPTTAGTHLVSVHSKDAKGNVAEDGLSVPVVDRSSSFAGWYFQTRQVIGVNYTEKGPKDGGTLYRGLPVAKANSLYLGRDGHTIFRWDDEHDVNTQTSPGGDFSWPRGTTFDSKRNRFLVVTLVGEGTLYSVTPATLEWSTIASMNNVDVDCIEYHPADDLLYMVENHGGTVRILRYNAEGQLTGETISIPDVPLAIGSAYQSRLISADEKLALLIEPAPGSLQADSAESRIYMIDPVANTSELTYRKQWEMWPPNTTPPISLKISSPANDSEFMRGVPIHLTAQAQNESISSVTFLSDGIGVGDAVASPSGVDPQTFTYIWSTAPAGSHSLRAFGRTTGGTNIYSDIVRIKVLQATNWPTVRFVAPTTNDVIHMGDHVPVRIEVFDADNNIQRLVFESRNGQKILTFDPPPTGANVYTFEYIPAFVGNNSLYAAVYDGVGLKAAANLVIKVLEAVPTPTIAINSPTNNTEFAQGAPIPINARGNVAFSNVWIFADGQKIGDAREALITIYPPSYGFTWSNAPAGEHNLVAVGLTTGNTSATSAPVHIVVRAVSPVLTIQRDLPDTYTAGVWVNVSIHATPNTLVNAWAVEETPPPGWQFGQASYNGVFDNATGKIKWGPFTDHEARTLFYTIRPPTNSIGIKTFSGIASVNGSSKPITGDTMISDSPAHHPGDVPPEDNRLTVNEVTAYAAAWKTGTKWPRGPSPIPIDYVTRAGQIWKTGEQYQFNPLLRPPSCWIPSVQKATTIGIAALVAPSAATRTLPPAFTPGHVTTVSVNVRPVAGVQNYAVEERPPAGWAIADAEGATVIDGALRYGPFYDALERTFIYHLVPSASVAGQFSGDASFDGSKDAIEGGALLTQPTTLAENRDGHVYLHFNATPGETFVLESVDSIDSASWQFETTVQGADSAIDLPPIAPSGNQKFYRLRPVAP